MDNFLEKSFSITDLHVTQKPLPRNTKGFIYILEKVNIFVSKRCKLSIK